MTHTHDERRNRDGSGAARAAASVPRQRTTQPDVTADTDEEDELASHRSRLLLVSTNYAPEHTGIGPYATGIAEHWASRGHETHVLAGLPHYPSWRLDPAYRTVWRATEQRAGVTVHRRWHSVPPRQSALRRALFESSILVHGLVAPPRTGRLDAVLAQLPSLAGGVLGARVAARDRKSVV